jgi:signal peptide peptidase SppA
MEGSEMPHPRRSDLVSLLEAPWAIQAATLSRIVDRIREAAATPVFAMDGVHDSPMRMGGVAVIPVYGVIEQRSDWMMEYFGGCSVDGIREALGAALADASVTAVVLDVDSPGGTVAGVTELAAEIRAARGGAKPIVASIDTLGASAAAWIALQADEVVITPSGHVGSIGVYAIHQDVSRMLDEMGVTMTLIAAGEHKTEGNEYEPLSSEARADIQSRVDASYGQFLADVAAGRGVTTAQVEADYGGGRVLTAKNALAVGMVDRIESLGQTVQRLGKTGGRRRVMAAEGAGPELAAEAGPEGDPDEAVPPFTERIAAMADEAAFLAEHARERARLRAKEGRPAFSTTTERSLRAIREAVDDLLEPDDPEPSETAPAEPVEPAPAAEPIKPAQPVTARRFRSDEEWLAYLQENP